MKTKRQYNANQKVITRKGKEQAGSGHEKEKKR